VQEFDGDLGTIPYMFRQIDIAKTASTQPALQVVIPYLLTDAV
jgi:hypothetical protein